MKDKALVGAPDGAQSPDEQEKLLWRLQDAADARKKRCAKTLAHQKGGLCLICGYDVLLVGRDTLGRA